MRKARWLIAGTGTIARRMASDLAASAGAAHVATLSRRADRARAFNLEQATSAAAFDDLAEAVQTTQPDIAYIATPHTEHAAIARRFIEQGVGVLVEKPFTCSRPETEALFDAAARARVYACEAMWTRFNPIVRALRAAIESGELGEIVGVRTAQGFRIPFDPRLRVWNPALGGGATLDLGGYGVALVVMAVGRLDVGRVVSRFAPNGLDAAGLVHLGNGAASATLEWALDEDIAGEATIVGTGGRAVLRAPFQRSTRLDLHATRGGRSVERPLQGLGFIPMIESVGGDVLAGRLSSSEMPPRDSLDVAGILDEILRILAGQRR